MKNERDTQKRDTKGDEPEIPGDFICIDLAQKPLVFEYLTRFNPDLKRTALVHLKLCLHCSELAGELLDEGELCQSWPVPFLQAEARLNSDRIS